MLTLLINESNPLDGLFANATTGGIGSVPDISVADEGQAVSVQSFTRAGGIITDSFVAGDVLHIGIGDGVDAPVCYVALSSASPATGTMPINTAGMVALFAATVANQLSLTLAVVRTRGAYTNTIFSAPIVIRRSAINISTAVPTPSILGTGVAAALQVAINTALGFVRLDASARLPAVDGSQLTNVPNELPSQTGNNGKYLTTNGTATSWGTVSTGLTVGTTAIASGTTTRVLYDNAGVLGEYAISGTGSVAMTNSPTFTTPALGTPASGTLTNCTGLPFAGLPVVNATTSAKSIGYAFGTNTTPTALAVTGGDATVARPVFDIYPQIYEPQLGPRFYFDDGVTYTKKARVQGFTGDLLHDIVGSNYYFRVSTDNTWSAVSSLLGLSGTVAGASSTLFTDKTTVVLFNTTSTTVSAFGAATTVTIGAATGTCTINNAALNLNSGAAIKFATTDVVLTHSTGILTLGTGTLKITTPTNTATSVVTIDATQTLTNKSIDAGQLTGTLAAARMANAGVHTGDATGTFPAITLNAVQTGITSVGTLTGGATGAGFTVALSTSTITGTLAAARGGTGVSNTGTITLGGNLVTTGAFNTTFAQAATTTVTLPATSATMARTDAAQTFTGVQSMTSPDITTSITTPSTTFAIANATATTLNIGGAATTVAIGAATGTMTVGNATLAAKMVTAAADVANASGAVVTITNTNSAASANVLTALTPNMGTNDTTYFNFGKANSTRNLAAIGFKYVGSGSTSNAFTIAFYGIGNQFSVNANGDTVMTGSASVGTTLAVTGATTHSGNGAASTAMISATGVPFAGTGTTSFPLVYINDTNATASTTLNTAGTYLGVNGDGTQDLMNLLKDGVSQFKVGSTGIVNTYRVTTTSAISSTNDGFTTSGNGTGTWFGRIITVNGNEMGVNANVGILFTTPYINATGTLAVTGATTLSAALITTPQALSGAGAVNITTAATDFTSTGAANALTLANGTVGQFKFISHAVKGTLGTGVLTPTTCIGFTTITFNNAGDSVTLRYTSAGWAVHGSFGAVIA